MVSMEADTSSGTPSLSADMNAGTKNKPPIGRLLLQKC